MTGFLDFLRTPEGQGLLGAAFSAAANAGRGGTLNTLGRAGMGGLMAYTGAQDRQVELAERKKMAEFRDFQMRNIESEIAARNAKLAKEQEGATFVNGLLSRRGQYVPGQLGSGTMDVVPNANPMAPPVGGGLTSVTPEEIALAKFRYGVDLMEPWKVAKQGFEQKPGVYRVDPTTGRMSYIPNPVDGRTVDQSGRVGMMPGASQATMEATLAAELPKALLNSAGRVNLRPNADGTQSPVAELTENPILQGFMGQVFPQSRSSVPQPALPSQRPTVSPEQQRGADAESVRIMRSELQNPNLSAADRAAIQRDIARLEQASARPGFPTPTMIRNPQGYGKTTQQQIAEDVEKTKRVEQAKADVRPIEQRQADISNARYMLSIIDGAIQHPGRETATGLSGTIDPRNYIPGTNATDFRTRLAQIKGGTFMQAYQNLKGGGQITEVEGKKAESAIARLETAQSDEAFLEALNEFRDVVAGSLRRMESASREGGATGDFSEPPKPETKSKRTVVRQGTLNGRRVIQYSDGTVEYAN